MIKASIIKFKYDYIISLYPMLVMYDELRKIEGQRGVLLVPLFLLKNGETLNLDMRRALDNLDNGILKRAAVILKESGFIVIRKDGVSKTSRQFFKLTDRGVEFAKKIDEIERLLKKSL